MRLNEILDSPSKTLATTLAVFCFGILIGPLVSVFDWRALLCVSLISFCAAIVIRRKARRLILILVSIFFLAMFRYVQVDSLSQTPLVVNSQSSALRVSGVVTREVERRVDRQRVVIDHVFYGQEQRFGRLLVWAPLYPEVGFGDEIVFNCRPETPAVFEGFKYDRYLASQGIYAVCMRPEYIDVRSGEKSVFGYILSFKFSIVTRLRDIISEPHASFLSGLLFGGSSALSGNLKDDFSQSGMSHILAASGFNVSLFTFTFLSWILTTRAGRKRGLLITAVLLLFYVLAAGATPSVIRAGFMGALVLLGKMISRKAYFLNMILIAASIMLFFNPLLLLGDVGFQLSFAATVAVVTLTKSVSERLKFIPETLGVRESFSGSLCAIAVTAPILLWHFGKISVVAPLANIIVLPLVPYAMALTIFGFVSSMLSGAIGLFASLPAWAFSFVMLSVISVFGAVPFAIAQPSHSKILAVIVAIIVFFCVRQIYVAREA